MNKVYCVMFMAFLVTGCAPSVQERVENLETQMIWKDAQLAAMQKEIAELRQQLHKQKE